MKQKVTIDKIHQNPDNPRTIKGVKFDKLVAKVKLPAPSVLKIPFADPSEIPRSVNTVGESVIPYPASVVGVFCTLLKSGSLVALIQVKPVHFKI